MVNLYIAYALFSDNYSRDIPSGSRFFRSLAPGGSIVGLGSYSSNFSFLKIEKTSGLIYGNNLHFKS